MSLIVPLRPCLNPPADPSAVASPSPMAAPPVPARCCSNLPCPSLPRSTGSSTPTVITASSFYLTASSLWRTARGREDLRRLLAYDPRPLPRLPPSSGSWFCPIAACGRSRGGAQNGSSYVAPCCSCWRLCYNSVEEVWSLSRTPPASFLDLARQPPPHPPNRSCCAPRSGVPWIGG